MSRPDVDRLGRPRALVPIVLLALSTPRAAEPPVPRPTTFEERAETRLAQVDLTVLGPAEAVTSLEAEDLVLRVDGRRILKFRLDRLCGAGAPRESPVDAAALSPAAEAAVSSGTVLFYFDQPMLTLSGRHSAIATARELVPRLVHDGREAMIVSSARAVSVIERPTADPARLDAALRRLESDRSQWDVFAEGEDGRVSDVLRFLNDAQVESAVARARGYQREEYWTTDRSLRRLAAALALLAERDPPRLVLYFADALRSNPGEHYLAFFGPLPRRTQAALGAMGADIGIAAHAFDRVLDEAASHGIRIYTIEARGLATLVEPSAMSPTAAEASRVVASTSRLRVGDAQRTLGALAGETGGRAFLNGVTARRMADRIEADSACIYLASFDPAGLAEDVPLRVEVTTRRPDVEILVRGRLVLASESARLTARLLTAFAAPDSVPDPFLVGARLVPTGFAGGRYVALLQVSVPEAPVPSAAWDIGASLVSGERVRERVSGRVTTPGLAGPVVLESEVRFRPGTFEIVAVAHETKSGLIASERARFDWPALPAGGAAIGPIVLLQPADASFVREGVMRREGSLALADDAPLDATRPAAFLALVCGSRDRGDWHVERSILGDTDHAFPSLEFEADEGGCAQIRDVVPSNVLRRGYYRYEVRLVAGTRLAASGDRVFFTTSPEPGSGGESR